MVFRTALTSAARRMTLAAASQVSLDDVHYWNGKERMVEVAKRRLPTALASEDARWRILRLRILTFHSRNFDRLSPLPL
jgi:hypothetical protein